MCVCRHMHFTLPLFSVSACKEAALVARDTAHHAPDWARPVGPFGPPLECKWCVPLLLYLMPLSSFLCVCVCVSFV